MKSGIKPLVLALFAAATPALQADFTPVPNGDFGTAGGALWLGAGDPNTSFSYPESGGNAGGYGVMTNNGTPFGVFVANDGDEIPLASLGLSAGESYNFSQDMTLLSGDAIGGMKIEFYAGGNQIGNTGDVYIPLIGNGTTWESYSYQVTIPDDTEAIKVVPLWGPGSSIGYDNIGVDNTPIVIPPGPLIPNGDFEAPGGAQWGFFEQGGHNVSYPSTGGNPGGFAQIDSSTSDGAQNFAGIAANNNAPIALSTLGLTAGETYTFTLDMKIISGPNIGKFKVEFVPTGTGDLTTEIIGDGSTWETYSFDITIPSVSTQIIIVPLWGADSIVGFDNVDIALPSELPFIADIQAGTALSWLPEGEGTLSQPQFSFDGLEWDDLGLLLPTGVTSTFATVQAPFYRVNEMEQVSSSIVANGDFELEGFGDPLCADSWTCLSASGQFPTWITSDSHTGDAAIRIAVQNDANATPNNAEIQQNIGSVGGVVVPGETYDFSFWAKQVSSGVSYVQQFRLNWLDDGGAILGGGVGFNDFSGGLGAWSKISVPGLVAPAGAATALIQIFGATGAVAGEEAEGEVLIDDLVLGGMSLQEFENLGAELSPGVEISWPSEDGKTYQVQSSTDLETFTDFGAPVAGDGERSATTDTPSVSTKLYRVIETP